MVSSLGCEGVGLLGGEQVGRYFLFTPPTLLWASSGVSAPPPPTHSCLNTHTHMHAHTHRCSTHTSNIQWQTETDILANALNLYSQHRLQGEYIIFFMSIYVWRIYVGQIIGLIWLWNIANVLTSWVVSGASLLTVYANEKPYLKPFIYCYIVQ